MTTIPNTAGDDTLVGTNDDDIFTSGNGSDLISARGGDDTIHVSGKSGTWADTIDGGDGTDRVVIDLDGIDSLLDFSRSIYRTSNDKFTLTDAGGNSITLTSIEEVEITGAVYRTQVQDHEGHLIDLENAVYVGMHISGSEESGVFFTDDSPPMGSDLSYPAPPYDDQGNIVTGFHLYGTDLDDSFQTVQLADGDSYVATFGGDDYLEGGLGADTLIGGDGDDELRVSDAGDRIQGGNGNDLVSIYLSTDIGPLSSIFTELNGGAGSDSLAVSYRAAAGTQYLSLADPFLDSFENISASANDADLIHVQGNAGANQITVSGQGRFYAFGGAGDDTIEAEGYGITATLSGGAGNDLLRANENDINLWGGAGDDTIISQKDGGVLGGGAGEDTLDGDFSDNTFYGGAGDDVIRAGNGNDLVYGGQGNDVITTRHGEHTIWGGPGDDRIDLGPSNEASVDQIWFEGDHGNDVITGFNTGDDILQLGGTLADFSTVADVKAATSAVTMDGLSGILIDTGGGNSIFVAGLTAADLTASNIAFD